MYLFPPGVCTRASVSNSVCLFVATVHARLFSHGLFKRDIRGHGKDYHLKTVYPIVKGDVCYRPIGAHAWKLACV